MASTGAVIEGEPPPHLRVPTVRRLARHLSPRPNSTRDSAMRSFVKHWAKVPAHREAMIAEPPRHGRITDRWHKWHKWNLVRIAAVVHALCDRDGVEIPDWVFEHRAPHHIAGSWATQWFLEVDAGGDPTKLRWYKDAPEACAWHRTWFDPSFIEDHRVHGFRKMY